MVKVAFHHGAGNDDKLVKALYGVLCYHMVDAYIIFSEDCRDISESARLFLHKDAEKEAALCLLDGLYRDLFVCDTAVPATVVVEKISQDGGIFPAPRPINMASSLASPCIKTALKESRTVARGWCSGISMG